LRLAEPILDSLSILEFFTTVAGSSALSCVEKTRRTTFEDSSTHVLVRPRNSEHQIP
jgi:hypothetical protein